MARYTFFFLCIACSLIGCEEQECVDCVDNEGNIFTFCEPAESPIDSVNCGSVYKDRK